MRPRLHHLRLRCKAAAEQRQFEANIKAKKELQKPNFELEEQRFERMPISETPF